MEQLRLLRLALKNLRSERQMRRQWIDTEHPENIMVHHYKMMALLELLETFDCGSIGGYGEGQRSHFYKAPTWERIQWILEKYEPMCEVLEGLASDPK